jgi:hypothetical protein
MTEIHTGRRKCCFGVVTNMRPEWWQQRPENDLDHEKHGKLVKAVIDVIMGEFSIASYEGQGLEVSTISQKQGIWDWSNQALPRWLSCLYMIEGL